MSQAADNTVIKDLVMTALVGIDAYIVDISDESNSGKSSRFAFRARRELAKLYRDLTGDSYEP